MALGNNPTPNELVKEVKEISSNYVKETITENDVATGILNRGEEGLRAGTSTTPQSQEPYQSLMLNANIEDQSIRLEATTEENTTLIGASSEGRAVVAVVDNSEGEMIAGIVADSEGNVAIGGTSLTFNESNVALEDDVPVESGTGKDSVKNKTPYDETDVDSHGNVIDRTNTVAGDFSAAFGSRNNIGAGSSETFVTGGKNTITHTEDALVSGYENTVSSSHQSIIGGYDNNVKASESVVVGEGNTVDGTVTGASYKTDTRSMAVFGNSNSVGINNKHSLIAGEDNEMGINGKWNFEVGAHHDVGRNNECVNVLGWTNTTNGYLTDSTLAGYDNTAYGGASGDNTFSVYMLGHSNDNQDPSNPSKGLSEVYQIGHGLLAKHRGQVILGKYNRGNVSEVNDILTVGCGTSNNSRSNCFGTGNNGTDNYIRVGTTPLTESKLSDLVNNAVTDFEVDGNTFSSNNSVELKTINGDYDGLHNKFATGNDLANKMDKTLTGTSAPTTSTAGQLGQLYIDTTNNKTYQCYAITTENNTTTYTWREIGSGGTATDVQVDDVSQVVSGVAKLKTKNGNYNASTNKFLTESDLPEKPPEITNTRTLKQPSAFEQKTWTGFTNFNGYNIWTDGENIYYSAGSIQYVLDVATSTWSQKTWSGLTNFQGQHVWTDGNDIYYSYDATQYVLNKTTSTWSQKTWSGLTSFQGLYIWTDGTNIYYSNGTTQYKKTSTSSWSSKTWTGLTNFNGYNIWTDGENIYYSADLTQYVLDISTSTWSAKTWIGLTDFAANNIWTDGENIYYGYYESYSKILKKPSTWSQKIWSGTSGIGFNSKNFWTDGENIYYSRESSGNVSAENLVLKMPRLAKLVLSTSAKTNPNNFSSLNYAVKKIAESYVSSVNGSTGAITDVAKTNANNTFSGTNNFTGTLQKSGVNVATVNDLTGFATQSGNNTFSGTNTFTGTVTVDGYKVGCLPSFTETALTKNATYTPTASGFIVARPTSNDKNGAYFKIREDNSSGNLLAGNHGSTGTSLGYNTMPTMMIPVSAGLTYYLQCSSSYYEFYFLSALT